MLKPSIVNENKEERSQALEKLDKEIKKKSTKQKVEKKKKIKKTEDSDEEEILDEEDDFENRISKELQREAASS